MLATSDSSVETESDPSGFVALCLPGDQETFLVRAEYQGRHAELSFAEPDTGHLIEKVLALGGSSSPATVQLRGRVVHRSGSESRPVSAAEVLVPALGRSARTAFDGSFSVGGLGSGSQVVIVRSIGFEPLLARLTLRAGSDSVIEFALRPLAAELAGVLVTAHPAGRGVLRAFEERRATHAGGTFVTRDDLAKREHSLLSDVLRSVRGTRLLRRPDGSTLLASPRGPFSPTIKDCYYQLYLDGQRIYAPGTRGPDGGVTPPDINDFAVSAIEAIEVYTGPATTPAQFSGLGAACGTVVLWTRVP
jgi:hypothetical protein